MNAAHAFIAPSALAATVQCNAYPRMAAPYANDPRTDEQLEGDAAHWVALQYGGNLDAVVALGTMTPQAIPVDLDMVQGAELWRDTVGLYGIAEVPVVVPRVHPTQCWGTPDYWRNDEIEEVLRVFDYKYGHRFVEVFENWQLIAYALGLLDMLNLNELTTWVELVIVQPRSYHRDGPVRRWKVKASNLRAYANVAAAAANAAIAPNPKATAGEYCLDCPARHECVTLQRSATRLADYSMTMDRVNLPPAALGAELTIVREALKRLEARETGLAAQAETAVRGGKRVPGFGLEPGRSVLEWTANAATVIASGDLMGADLRQAVKPITPTQAKKLKKVDAAVIDALASPSKATMRLVEESTDQTRKIFGVISI